MAQEKQKLILRSTSDGTVRLPQEWMESLKWSLNSEIIVSNAFWDNKDRCHKITLEKSNPEEKTAKGKWAR